MLRSLLPSQSIRRPRAQPTTPQRPRQRFLPSLVASVGLLAILGSSTLGANGRAQTEDAQEPDFLPTPYSAEQIRDAWYQGLWLETRTTTPDGVQRSRTDVVAWTDETVEITESFYDSLGELRAAGEPYTARWQELRDHARFAATTARRDRATRTTPLGTYDGWLYVVWAPADASSDGTIPSTRREIFFADDLPGSPLQFRMFVDGEETMLAEQVERADVDGH